MAGIAPDEFFTAAARPEIMNAASSQLPPARLRLGGSPDFLPRGTRRKCHNQLKPAPFPGWLAGSFAAPLPAPSIPQASIHYQYTFQPATISSRARLSFSLIPTGCKDKGLLNRGPSITRVWASPPSPQGDMPISSQ